MRILTPVAASLTLIVATLLMEAPIARAKATAEQHCQNSRHTAAANYAQCEYKAMAKYFGGDTAKLEATLSKCRVKYTGTWPKLQKNAQGTGSTCDAPRFVDRGSSVADNLTGLRWEKQQDFGGPSGKDNVLTWSSFDERPNGTVFGVHLKDYNDLDFDGFRDWRLPTRAELQTILLQPFVCTTSPCIDVVFGPAAADFYWTSTEDAVDGSLVWVVQFATGLVGNASKTDSWHVRIVRGGL